MVLQELFDSLTHGELSQVYVGGAESEDGQIREEDRARIINCLQLGLTALYKRFHIREGRVRVMMIPNQSIYILDKHFLIDRTDPNAVVTPLPSGAISYLDDSEWPFSDNPLKIDEVYDDLGDPLRINDRYSPDSIRTPNVNTISVPQIIRERGYSAKECDRPQQFLDVVYRANHPKIDVIEACAAPMAYDIELPEAYVEALLYFVASRVMNPVGMSGEFHSGNNWASKYEYACQRLENENLDIDDFGEEDKFSQAGFV